MFGWFSVETARMNTSGIACDQSRCCHFSGIYAVMVHTEFQADVNSRHKDSVEIAVDKQAGELSGAPFPGHSSKFDS